MPYRYPLVLNLAPYPLAPFPLLHDIILRERNKEVKTQSINNWMRRHPKIIEQLHKEIIEEEKPELEVNETIFNNGVFEELESVKEWMQLMTLRENSPTLIKDRIRCLKRICRGHLIKDPVLKHPDRFNVEDAKEYLAGITGLRETAPYRQTIRLFLMSKGVPRVELDRAGIHGHKAKGSGKYKDVSVEKEILYEILNYIKEFSYDIYLADKTMLKTATRIRACLNEVRKSNIIKRGRLIYCSITDKGLHRTGRQTWLKLIPQDLYEELEKLREKHGQDQYFANIVYDDICKINKMAYEKFLEGKALQLALDQPNHFWRHMFAQLMLRATKDWNYGVVASLGGWKDINTLRDHYGMPPDAVVRKWGLEHIPQI